MLTAYVAMQNLCEITVATLDTPDTFAGPDARLKVGSRLLPE